MRLPVLSASRARVRAALVALVLFAILPASAPLARAQEPAHTPGVPVTEYAARRRALMSKLKDGIVVLRGSTEDEFGEVGRFRQNNAFYYLTGCETPAAFLMLNPMAPEAEREVLYIPARDLAQERWTGVQIAPGPEAAARFGIQQVHDAAKLDAEVRAALAAAPLVDRLKKGDAFTVSTVFPAGEGAEFTRERAFALHLANLTEGRFKTSFSVVNVELTLGEMRRTKSAEETKLLQRAIDVTGEAQRDVAKLMAPGRYENELEATIIAAYLRNGAMRAGFPSIVGSGVYSTILHYNSNTKKIDDGDLVVVDIGAEYGYYTADITRTYPASGTFTSRQREIYQLVLDTQEAAQKFYKPGMNQRDLHNFAVEYLHRSPLRDSHGNTLERYFTHGLGHFLGMDVHDVGLYGPPLKPGDVITLEPGVYLTDEKLGVRIEDDYLVTETGLVKLSIAIPSTVEEIERAVRAGKQ